MRVADFVRATMAIGAITLMGSMAPAHAQSTAGCQPDSLTRHRHTLASPNYVLELEIPDNWTAQQATDRIVAGAPDRVARINDMLMEVLWQGRGQNIFFATVPSGCAEIDLFVRERQPSEQWDVEALVRQAVANEADRFQRLFGSTPSQATRRVPVSGGGQGAVATLAGAGRASLVVVSVGAERALTARVITRDVDYRAYQQTFVQLVNGIKFRDPRAATPSISMLKSSSDGVPDWLKGASDVMSNSIVNTWMLDSLPGVRR